MESQCVQYDISITSIILMKSSTIVFYSRSQETSTLYRLPKNQLVSEYEFYSHSTLLSLAAYLVWKLPYLPAPHIDQITKPKFTVDTFPDVLLVSHPMFDYWAELLLQEMAAGNALRQKQTLYFKKEISAEYGQKLLDNGFEEETIQGPVDWKSINPDLDEQELRRDSKNKTILVISCGLLRFHKGDYHSVALIAGLYFNNENWRTFRVMYDEFPTQQQYKEATHIVVPGSHLCISVNIEPQIKRLIDQLRVVFKTNRKLRFMGICYGHQLLSQILNPGHVRRATKPVFGLVSVNFQTDNVHQSLDFLKDVEKINIYSFHYDEVISVPEGFKKIGSSNECAVEAMASTCGRFFSLQSHPEYTALKYRSVMAVNKVATQNICRDEMMKIIKGNDTKSDESLKAQQVCREFLRN